MKTIPHILLMAVVLLLIATACTSPASQPVSPTPTSPDQSLPVTQEPSPTKPAAPEPTPLTVEPSALPPAPTHAATDAPVVLSGQGAVRALAFSPDGKRLAAGFASQEGVVLVWDLEAGLSAGMDPNHRLVAPMKDETTWITSLSFNRDGQTLAAGAANGEVFVWDLSQVAQEPGMTITPQQTGQDCSQTKNCNSLVQFSPVENLLAIAYESYTPTGKIVLWALDTKKVGVSLPGTYVMALAFSPDGSQLAAGGSGGQIYSWKVASGEPILNITEPGAGITGLAYTPGGKMLVTGHINGVVQSWHSDDGKPSGLMLTMLSDAYGFALSPDGRTIVLGADQGKMAWLTRDETGIAMPVVQDYPDFSGHVFQVAFSPDGKLFAAGSEAGTVTLWPSEVFWSK